MGNPLRVLVVDDSEDDAAQGYFWSPPLPAEELTRWLRESPWGVPSRHP